MTYSSGYYSGLFGTAIAFAGGIMLWRKRRIGVYISFASLLFSIALSLHIWENLFSVLRYNSVVSQSQI
jgi:hypothetical protein